MPTVSVVELDDQGNEIQEKTKSFQVDMAEIIYDALDNQGEKLPHGCLAGSCGSCRVLIIEGDENLAGMSVIEQNTVDNIKSDYEKNANADFYKGKTIRLSCRARIKGDVKISPLKK